MNRETFQLWDKSCELTGYHGGVLQSSYVWKEMHLCVQYNNVSPTQSIIRKK